VFHVGDVVLCNGPRQQLEKLRDLLGVEAGMALHEIDSPLVSRDMLVSQNKVFGKHIADLHIRDLYGVTITRLNRAGIDLTPSPTVKLQFGDYLTCVGEDDRLKQVETLIGNQSSALNHTQIIPIFIGIALGVLLGSIPVYIPGVPVPLALGLAGGPVVAAIILARIGTIGPLRWNMPPDTIDTLRELGVSMFMACVGIYAGKSFVATVMNGDGLLWMGSTTRCGTSRWRWNSRAPTSTSACCRAATKVSSCLGKSVPRWNSLAIAGTLHRGGFSNRP
jgi:putative transport protein